MDRNPEHLDRSVREQINRLCSEFRRATNGAYHLDAFETWRNGTRQALALANGASTKGPGQSKHNITHLDGSPRSFACDMRVVDSITGAVFSGTTQREFLVYAIAGRIWESFGGIWGGRWKTPCDPGHFEAPGNLVDLKAGIPPGWLEEPVPVESEQPQSPRPRYAHETE